MSTDGLTLVVVGFCHEYLVFQGVVYHHLLAVVLTVVERWVLTKYLSYPSALACTITISCSLFVELRPCTCCVAYREVEGVNVTTDDWQWCLISISSLLRFGCVLVPEPLTRGVLLISLIFLYWVALVLALLQYLSFVCPFTT